MKLNLTTLSILLFSLILFIGCGSNPADSEEHKALMEEHAKMEADHEKLAKQHEEMEAMHKKMVTEHDALSDP